MGNIILHLANDYSGSTVYMNLISEIDFLGLEQIVYNPVRSASLMGRNEVVFKTQKSRIIYNHILNKHTDRIFYRKKIKKIFHNIDATINIDEVKITHAHTWYSDGGVAFEIYKKYNIPYIVTVRNTDLNLFYKYMLHLRQYGLEILKYANKVIFVSPVYSERLRDQFNFRFKSDIGRKSLIIPNGIDSFWIHNVKKRKERISSPIQLLYIGKFNKGKNVIRLLKSVALLNKAGTSCHLHIVGGGGSEEAKVLSIIKDNTQFSFYGKITDKPTLAKFFNKCDIFVMPSHYETFGLVYLEALSQGIPVLYTKNEGIDGHYGPLIGEAVNSKSINEIAAGLEEMCNNYHKYLFDPAQIIKNHDWKNIAKQYKFTYDRILIEQKPDVPLL